MRNGLTAEAGVEKVQSDMRARLSTVTDPYLRERMSDFDDLANRLLRQLISGEPSHGAKSLPEDAIIVARHMGAAELLDIKPTTLASRMKALEVDARTFRARR